MKKKQRAVAGQQTDEQIATLAQQAMVPTAMPDPSSGSITDRIMMNDEMARRRRGRVSTLANGAYGKAPTTKTIAMSGL